MFRRSWLPVAVAAAGMACFTPLASAATVSANTVPPLLGNWNFASGSGADLTGNWSTFTLHGNAQLSGGLVVSGTGNAVNAATGWAEASGYSGPTIADKTLVSWVKLDSTSVTSGSPLSLDKPEPYNRDVFDALDYAELRPDQWMAGSDYFTRTQQFDPGSVDNAGPNVVRQIAISYHSNGNGTQTITGCLNGTSLGSYTAANTATFAAAEQPLALFGPRYAEEELNYAPIGSIDAHILTSQIYGGAMSCAQIASIHQPIPVLRFDAHAYGAKVRVTGHTLLGSLGPTAPADLTCTVTPGSDKRRSSGATSSVSGTRAAHGKQKAKATSTLSGGQADLTASGTINATATAGIGRGGTVTAKGTASFLGVRLDGKVLPYEPAPNTVLHFVNGTVVLNEQTAVTDTGGDTVGITVNAIDATFGTVHTVVGHTMAALTSQSDPCPTP